MKTKFLLIVAFLAILSEGFAQQRPNFNKNTDILIAQFDSKPDPDDIHAQAALGSMLAHPDLQGVNFYAVAGAIGKQNGDFIESGNLMNIAFGQGNWTHAIKSNITRDWAQILQNRLGANTVKNNVIVVQHSEWNVNLTDNNSNKAASNPAIMNWIKNNTNYFYLDDGNAGFTQLKHGEIMVHGKHLRTEVEMENG